MTATTVGGLQLPGGLDTRTLIALLLPVIVIQAAVIIAALVNLRGKETEQLRGGKRLWKILLILSLLTYPTGIIVPIAYFALGDRRMPPSGDFDVRG